MTSFQRFKRDMRTRNNSQGKSSIRKVSQINDKRIHDQVFFSASEIVFNFDPNAPVCICILKITNATGFKIHYKIRCNNSKCYTVNPFEQVIHNEQTREVKFQFLPNLYENNQPNLNDKFQIMWGKIPYQPTQPASLTESKILPVKIVQKAGSYQDLFKGFGSTPKSSSRQQLNIQTQYQQQWPQQKSPLLGMVQTKIINQIIESNVTYETLLTKMNLILVCAISFVLGFIFS